MSQDRITPVPPRPGLHRLLGNGDSSHDDEPVTRGEFRSFVGEQDEKWGGILSEIGQMRVAVQGIAKHVEVPGSIPPMRPRAESVSDLEEEVTLHGTKTGRVVTAASPYRSVEMSPDAREAVELVAETRARTMLNKLLDERAEKDRVTSAAAPVLFLRGSVPTTLRALFPLVAIAIWEGLKAIWSRIHP